MNTAVATEPLLSTRPSGNRKEILAELEQCHARIRILTKRLPDVCKKFYQWRIIEPRDLRTVYCDTLEQAKEILFRVLSREYGADGFTVAPRPEIFSGPDGAGGATNAVRGSLLQGLLPSDGAAQFIRHYREDRPNFENSSRGGLTVKVALSPIQNQILNFEANNPKR